MERPDGNSGQSDARSVSGCPDVSRETWWLAAPEDAARIRALAARIWWQVYPPLIGEAQVSYMLETMYAPERVAAELRAGIDYVVLALASRPVGFYALEITGTQVRRVARLHKLYLEPACHGRGLGQRMIADAARRASRAGASALELTVNKYNQPALNAYRRAGFEIVESFVKDIGQGFVMDDYRMRKALD